MPRQEKMIQYGPLLLPWSQRPTEKVVQQRCVQLFVLAGFEKPASTSQYRASHVALGIPDLILFHVPLQVSGYWETKRPGETLSPKQLVWRTLCLGTSTLHGWGTDEDLKHWLVALGVAHLTTGVFGLRQRSRWAEVPLTSERVRLASLLHQPE